MLALSDVIRGYTDTIILAQLMFGDSYGYEISRNIVEVSNKKLELKEATLYTAFKRLEGIKYIESYWGNENITARRRYYKITNLGREIYKENINDWLMFKDMIDNLLQVD